MKKVLIIGITLLICAASISAQNKYQMQCWIVGDSLMVNVDYVSEKTSPDVGDYSLLSQVVQIKAISTGSIGYTFHNHEDTVRLLKQSDIFSR